MSDLSPYGYGLCNVVWLSPFSRRTEGPAFSYFPTAYRIIADISVVAVGGSYPRTPSTGSPTSPPVMSSGL